MQGLDSINWNVETRQSDSSYRDLKRTLEINGRSVEMGFLTPKKRSASELYGFFAANDEQLSSWLNNQNSSERAEMIGMLEAVLSIPTKHMFETRLHNLYAQYLGATKDSEQRARLGAVTRVLGYEYERTHKGDMSSLIDDLLVAERQSDPVDEDPPANLFFQTALVISQANREFGDIREIFEQDRKLASSSLFAAAMAATLLTLGARGDEEDDDTCVRIAEILDAQDSTWAARTISALSWYFALAFIGSLEHSNEIDREGWVSAMWLALGPNDELCLVEEPAALELFDNYKKLLDGTSENFLIQFTRWVNLQIGLTEEVDIISSMAVARALQMSRDEFGADLVREGLWNSNRFS